MAHTKFTQVAINHTQSSSTTDTPAYGLTQLLVVLPFVIPGSQVHWQFWEHFDPVNMITPLQSHFLEINWSFVLYQHHPVEDSVLCRAVHRQKRYWQGFVPSAYLSAQVQSHLCLTNSDVVVYLGSQRPAVANCPSTTCQNDRLLDIPYVCAQKCDG